MLIKASREVTQISEKDEINSSNYIESLNYINNLYKFINAIKKVIPTKEIVFIPTFKGFHTCEKYGITAKCIESEMRYFIVKSELFLEDKQLYKSIETEMGTMCESIIINKDTIEFILR